METRKLKKKDICGYLPYELMTWNGIPGGHEDNFVEMNIIGYSKSSNRFHLQIDTSNDSFVHIDEIKPILYPLDTLYKTITHNGEEIVPIIECAKIAFPNMDFEINEFGFCKEKGLGRYFEYKKDGFVFNQIFHVPNQYKLFDYLDELKIDYRGLIENNLSISVHDIDRNLYNNLGIFGRSI